ncbi:hypothetical protein KIN_28630 [Litoreibacter roseus]|uniref:RSAM-associated Gly-rich repeat protein n=1 Tax=Litoreibacter roseus TaxID=2601869 RepID=A0A6N6JK39_9RHOB|nr:hypothetical protein KIN_28630 [Litoreibacter roseus]
MYRFGIRIAAFALTSVTVVLGGSTQASTPNSDTLRTEKASLTERLDAARSATGVTPKEVPGPLAQWRNWSNWNNWSNWRNWPNW